VQLSRELARRGHHVTHVYPIGLQGPKGRLQPSESDSGRLEIRGVPLDRGFRKYSPWRRLAAQRRYARDLGRIVSGGRFDVALSGNTPIDVQFALLRHCRSNRVGFVHWIQDVYCKALEFFLRRRIGSFAARLSFPFFLMERWVALHSDANIAIAPAFTEILSEWGVPPQRTAVLENWAPLDEMLPLARTNAWSREHGLDSRVVFLYSGTLGMKHRPDLLYQLAESLDASCSVVVISEGPGREYLAKMPKLGNLLLLDFQPYDRVPEVLASADVLLATLESDAGQFAVPSKVLSYLCAGRPLLLAAPGANLAASIIERSGAGIVVDPDHSEEWIGAARRLAGDAGLRASLGASARRYAEHEFEISRIAARFEEVLERACVPSLPSVTSAPFPENVSAQDLAVAPASEIQS
jgi:glycosyltransferase involved in cell wall biosynthesis